MSEGVGGSVGADLPLAFRSSESFRPEPFADALSCAFGRVADQREFVVGEADGDRVGAGVVAAGSTHLCHASRIAYAESIARPHIAVYDKYMHTMTADLTSDQLETALARSEKRCRFGHMHSWIFEYDLKASKNSGWVYCSSCSAREWEGE